jgi:hypothetical protein
MVVQFVVDWEKRVQIVERRQVQGEIFSGCLMGVGFGLQKFEPI